MHYDFKKKINKIDSQQNRNLLIPEIDWNLNEAIEIFIKNIAEPRTKSYFGFEMNQRSIDDIRTLVVNNQCLIVNNNIVTLPDNYLHFVKGEVLMSKNNCKNIKGKFKLRQHDDDFENSPFDNSNFEWRTVNGIFFENGIKLFDDTTFINEQLCISYIRKPSYVHNAEDFRTGTYKLPSGIVLTGSVNCELPEHTHREIVDIAVMIATGELQIPDYEIKMNKLRLNQLM